MQSMGYTKLLSVMTLIFFTGCNGASKETIEAGALLYNTKCSECHGRDGATKALEKAAVLTGQSQVEIENKLKAYKAGIRNESGMGKWKQGMLTPFSDADINALAAYISTL